jgi:large subunit ribosomal protein L18
MDEKVIKRLRRHKRVRKKVSGDPERPRLNVYSSMNHIYAQIIDDTSQRTLVSASSLEKDLRGQIKGGNVEGAKVVGRLIAERALSAGIEAVRFDRGGYKYHGRVKSLADAAREAGLKF